MAELAGVMVGNYFLLECLSSEGMVETYLARPTTQGGYDVYLRLFRPRFPDPLAFQDHFPAEVRKVWRCQHPHIQPLTAFGTGDGVLYTATKADETPTLAEVLEKRGDDRLPVPLVAELLIQLCAALQYAHERDIVHGNLQPSSILLDAKNQVRLTNFGLRRAYQDGDPTVAQIEEGNAAYVAPEQVVGMLSPASDIYALGVLLYRLLGGELPYAGENAGEIAMMHANEPIPSLCALRPDLPPAVEMVMRIALAKNPGARFSTPHELAAAFIQALAKDSPPVITATTARRIAVNPRRTNLTWSRAFSLMALVLIMTGLSSTLYLFSLSRLPFGPLPGFTLPTSGGPGSFSIFFPAQHSTPVPPGNVAATQPTPGHKHHTTPTPGGHVSPTPEPTSTPGIQQSPIILPATPTVLPGPKPIPLTCIPGTLSIDGSFYLAPLLQQVGNDYQTFCPGLTLNLGDRGCEAGLKALKDGQVDLAASDLSVQNAQEFTDYPIAAFLYTLIVSPDVQISGLSSQQLQAIYHGQITNWSQVGGPNEAISILRHPSSDPLNSIFQTFVLNDTAVSLADPDPSKQLTPEQLVQEVSQTHGAITYASLAVTGAAPVRLLALNRVRPTFQNLLLGTYPFWSVEHLYAPSVTSAQALAYMRFFQAIQEANRLAQAGALPLNVLPSSLLSSHLPGPTISI